MAYVNIRRIALSFSSAIRHNLFQLTEGQKMNHSLTLQVSLSDSYDVAIEKITAALAA